MQIFTVDQAGARFNELLDSAQHEPVRVVRDGRVLGVMVSAEGYEASRAFYVNRLCRTMDEIAEGAATTGLTDAILSELLADES